MKLFKKLRKRIDDWITPGNRDYEFDAELENHAIPMGYVYRLYHVNIHRIQEYPGRSDDNIGIAEWAGKPFKMPKGMSREDGFKVLSYLTDNIEKHGQAEPCSLKSVRTLQSVIELERFGFITEGIEDAKQPIDLFTVTGRVLLFKERSWLYSKYFNWYVENVRLQEVKWIYKRCGLEFSDIVWLD